MGLKTRHQYEFGQFLLEPGECSLLREDRPVQIAPKAFELLVVLVQNAGRLVTKDQIMGAVWPGCFVEEANLTVCVSAVRKALEEKDGELRYIETIPKKGYRFIAPVREIGVPSDPGTTDDNGDRLKIDSLSLTAAVASGAAAPHERDEPIVVMGTSMSTPDVSINGESGIPQVLRTDVRWRWRRAWLVVTQVATLGIVIVIGYRAFRKAPSKPQVSKAPISLAILPFENIRKDPNDDFLGFSLADAAITKLGYVSSLTVRPSLDIERYRDQVIDIRKAGADLNAEVLLTGNFIHEGDDLRITSQLIDVKSDKILWRDTLDLKYDKLLTVQDRVASEIVRGLELNLSPSETERLRWNQPINPLAYEYYLRGVDLYSRHVFPLAIKMLEKSADIDSKYALTWAYLGASYTSDAAFEFGGRDQYRKAQAAYEHALSLQPGQLEAQMFLANLLIDTGKVEQAVPLLRDALKTNPNHAAVHWELAYAYRFAGMLKESVAECELARQIDPLVKANNGSACNTYLYLGQYEEFLGSLPDFPDSAFVLFYRGFGEYYQNRREQAIKDFDRAFDLDPSLYSEIGKAFSDSIAHRNKDGLEILRGLEKKIREYGVGDPEAMYKVAQAYAALGDKASALRVFEQSIENGFFCYPYFATDPLLNGLRNEFKFIRLLNMARERHEAFASKFSYQASTNMVPVRRLGE